MGISGQISLKINRLCINAYFTEIIICSFNNNTIEKWANSKAFNIIVASAQFFASLIPASFGTFVCLFLRQSFKINLQVVNSPNSRDKFWDMSHRYVFDIISSEFPGITRVFVNFAGFRRFTWILQLRNRAKYQKPCKKDNINHRWCLTLWQTADTKPTVFLLVYLNWSPALDSWAKVATRQWR